MTVYYEHHLHTGSGWTKVILYFPNDGFAAIYFDSRWMYPGIRRYRLAWSHEALSESHGLLKLRAVERYPTLDSVYPIVEDFSQLHLTADPSQDWNATIHELTYEYILLAKSDSWIANDASLDEMRSIGLAEWHDFFDLILLNQFSPIMEDREFLQSSVGSMLFELDKMKFKVVAEPVFGYTNPWESHQSDSDVPF